MSLQTDIIFVRALRSSNDLMAQLPAGDVYNTAIAMPEEDADNAPLPYIIVTYDGMQNDQSTKDGYESEFDQVTIGIEVAAATRKQLYDITQAVRLTIKGFFETIMEDPTDEDYLLIPQDYQLSAQPIRYDDMKPCYWQIINYQCDTYAENNETDTEIEG